METLSEGWRDTGREEERVMVRISIPQCWSALLQSLRGMGLGMERGRGERERGCAGGGGGRDGVGEGARERGYSVAAESPPACLLRSTSD